MRSFRPAAPAALAAATLFLLTTGCGDTDGGDAAAGAGDGPVVVASTTWVGALAEAAGATDIALIAPANLQHPPDYDPKPSDLATVASADYVLYSPFDGFVPRLEDAAGSGAELVVVEPENTLEQITAEVTRLAEMFGTEAAAQTWLADFEAEYEELSGELRDSALGSMTTVAQVYVAYWAEFAGAPVAGTYGPQPVTPDQLAELSGMEPQLQLANGHLPGANPEIDGVARVDIVNYPGADLDLLSVFRTNADKLAAAAG